MITITALNLTNTTRFIKSSWTPSTDRDPALNTYVDLTANRNRITDNLTKDEQALHNLKKRQEILNNQTCWQRLWNGCYGKILVHRRMQPTVNPRASGVQGGGGGERRWHPPPPPPIRIKVFPPKVKSFQNIATYQTKLRSEVPSNPLPPPCTMVGLWICVYVRGLNGAKFYRQLDGDITKQRVTVYIERMFNDGYIDEKTKKYL